MGYAPVDIITVVFRVVKNYEMPEYIKLEFIKVRSSAGVPSRRSLDMPPLNAPIPFPFSLALIGNWTHAHAHSQRRGQLYAADGAGSAALPLRH